MLFVQKQPLLLLQNIPIMHHADISSAFHCSVSAIDLSCSGERGNTDKPRGKFITGLWGTGTLAEMAKDNMFFYYYYYFKISQEKVIVLACLKLSLTLCLP